MNKFKVGDLLIGTKTNPYGITNQWTIVKVLDISDDGAIYVKVIKLHPTTPDDVKQIFNYELNNIRFVLDVFDLIYQLYDVKFNVYCRTRAVSALIPALSKDRNVIHTRQFNIRFVGDNAISLHQFRNRECYTLVDEQYLKWMKAEIFAPYLPCFNFAPLKFKRSKSK